MLQKGWGPGAKSDSKASRAVPSAAATQTHSTEQEQSGSGDVSWVQPTALCLPDETAAMRSEVNTGSHVNMSAPPFKLKCNSRA